MQLMLPWKTTSITYSECVFLDLGIEHEMRMCHVVFCGLTGTTLFSRLSHKWHDVEEKY